jgi:hypothetical protein
MIAVYPNAYCIATCDSCCKWIPEKELFVMHAYGDTYCESCHASSAETASRSLGEIGYIGGGKLGHV